MTSRSGRGRWERVLAARRQAREVLGWDPTASDPYDAPPKRRTLPLAAPPAATPVPLGPGVGALFIGEAAVRLGMTRAELEAMITRGQVKTLPTQFVRVIPTSEVARLQRKG
jgi:hypothetical protein